MKTAERKRNLKMTLIAAAERAVAARGFGELRARSLAAEAGCAVGAIYNVVADLDDLALAVNSRTHAALEEVLTAATGVDLAKPAVGTERATGRLIHLAVAYLDFAAASTLRWRALFEHRLPAGKPMPDWYLGEQIRLFGHIEQPLRDLLPNMPPEQLAMLARSLFSAVHGIVTLGLEEKLGAVSLEELRNQTTLIVSAIVTGLLTPGKAVL